MHLKYIYSREYDAANALDVSAGDLIGFYGPNYLVSCVYSYASTLHGTPVGFTGPTYQTFDLSSSPTPPTSGQQLVNGGAMNQRTDFRHQLARLYVADPSKEMWLAVDLGLKTLVARVLVYTAADRFGYSLIDAELRVGDSLESPITESTQFCDYAPTTLKLESELRTPIRPFEFVCLPPTAGKFAVIRRRSPGVLPIAEILIFPL